MSAYPPAGFVRAVTYRHRLKDRAMPVIADNALPATSLLHAYRDRRAYTDCFHIDLPGAVSLADYIDAFYTTWLFKLNAWCWPRWSRSRQAMRRRLP